MNLLCSERSAGFGWCVALSQRVKGVQVATLYGEIFCQSSNAETNQTSAELFLLYVQN